MNTASETSSVMITSLAAPLYAEPAALLYVLLGFSLASRKRACAESCAFISLSRLVRSC